MNETILYLLEKITRTRIMLEGMMLVHGDDCPFSDDSGPCACGAEAHNAKVGAVLRELKVPPDKIKIW